jgi:endoglycosylceramidase
LSACTSSGPQKDTGPEGDVRAVEGLAENDPGRIQDPSDAESGGDVRHAEDTKTDLPDLCFDLSDGGAEATSPDSGEPDGISDQADGDGPQPFAFPPPPPYTPTGFVGTDGRYFRDEEGRLLVLRGVNVSNGNKNAPFFASWQDESDFAMLGERGMNVIRFVMQWEGLEPAPGQYDNAYLDKVAERVQWAEDAGLYVILDMHQDLWGPKFGGNGAPLWATIDNGIPFDPPQGGMWFSIYGEPAVQQAFQSFWDDVDGIQQHYVQAWTHVAQRFAYSHTVIGYDIINEPYQGTYPLTEVAKFEAEELVPFYVAVAKGIRTVDEHHILFIEPTATRSLGVLGGMGPIGDDKVALATHYYCPTMDLLATYDGKPEILEALFQQFHEEAWKVGGPLFLGEWGFFVGNEGDLLYADHQLALFDKMSLSFSAWTLDPCGGNFCLVSPSHEPHWSLERLTQVRPERVPGAIVSWKHDRSSRSFELAFDTSGFGPGDAVVSLPPLLYPEGASVHCAGPDGQPCPAQLVPEAREARFGPLADTPGVHVVTVTLPGTIPAPAIGLSTHIPLGSGSAAQAQELDMEQQAGVKWIRTDFAWSTIEPVEGEFHFEAYDPMVDEALAHGIQVVALLDYGVGWARTEPGNDSSLDAGKFGKFAGAVAQHFKGRISTFEIWNEEDLPNFFKPEPDPQKYGELLRHAHAAIRAANPGALVLFGGLSSASVAVGKPWGFFEEVLHLHPDLGSHFDALAIHPYTLAQSLAPEQENPAGTLEDMLIAARKVLSRFGLERKPLWLTELGWPACPCPPLEPPVFIPNVSYEDQASYLVRSALLAWRQRAATWLWYDFIDADGSVPLFSENYFGLVQHDTNPEDGIPPAPKPAFQALSAMTKLLDGHVLTGETPPSAHCHALKFDKGALAVWAAWNSHAGDQECSFAFPIPPGKSGKLLAIDGTSTGVTFSAPEASLTLGSGELRYLVVE